METLTAKNASEGTLRREQARQGEVLRGRRAAQSIAPMRLAVLTAEPLPDYTRATVAELEQRGHELMLIESPEAAIDLPDAAWMRVVPGSFRSQIPYYWQAAQLLEVLDVPLLNPTRAHELASNKLVSYEIFRRAGMPQPLTMAAAGNESAADRFPMVVKPQFGSRGRDIILAGCAAEVIEHGNSLGEMLLLQEQVKSRRCLRLVATPDEVIDCYEKRGEPGELILSVYQGATRVTAPVGAELIELATSACRLLGGRLMGIDILEDEDGQPWLLEANASFAFDADNAGLVAAFADQVEALALARKPA